MTRKCHVPFCRAVGGVTRLLTLILTIVDRWFASSQICSCCGKSGGKKELHVREWECLYCNTIHDRDICAAENLNKWAGGQSDQYKNERGVSVSQSKIAVRVETLTTYEQLSLF